MTDRTDHHWGQILVFDGMLGMPEELRPVRVYAPYEENCLVTARLCLLSWYAGQGNGFKVSEQWAKGPVKHLDEYEGDLPSFE